MVTCSGLRSLDIVSATTALKLSCTVCVKVPTLKFNLIFNPSNTPDEERPRKGLGRFSARDVGSQCGLMSSSIKSIIRG